MADVSPLTRDREQMILVGAFALSMTFVAFALLLNSAVYTQNLADRNGDAGADEAIEFKSEARVAANGIIAQIQDNSGSVDDDFTPNMKEWSDRAARHYALDGIEIDVSVKEIDAGSVTLDIIYRSSQVNYATEIMVPR